MPFGVRISGTVNNALQGYTAYTIRLVLSGENDSTQVRGVNMRACVPPSLQLVSAFGLRMAHISSCLFSFLRACIL